MKIKKDIITLIDFPDKILQPNNYNVTLIIPLLDKAFKISALDKLSKLLKKLLTRPKPIIKEKELSFLNLMFYESIQIEKFALRKFSVVTNKGLVLNISDYHACTVDSVNDNDELNLIQSYIQNYENSIENISKNFKINYLIFHYTISEKPNKLD
jgi:hypothetical protein